MEGSLRLNRSPGILRPRDNPRRWWNRRAPPPLGLGHPIPDPPSWGLPDGPRITGAAGHVPRAPYPKANHSETQLSELGCAETT